MAKVQLSAVQSGSDHHHRAQPTIGAEPHRGVDAVHPHLDVVSSTKIAPHELLALFLLP
jgi:hypothetical protein